MKNAKNLTAMLAIGGSAYALIEILWRGRTHWSMITAGGLCFYIMSKIAKSMEKSHLLYKCIACSAVITSVELIYGCIFNILLKKDVWDYSGVPFNFGGQICLLYSVLCGFPSIPCLRHKKTTIEALNRD